MLKLPPQLATLDPAKVAGLMALGSVALLVMMHRSFAGVRVG